MRFALRAVTRPTTTLGHVHSLDPASQATQLAALDAIATALSDPTIFDLDPLFRLDATLAAQALFATSGYS